MSYSSLPGFISPAGSSACLMLRISAIATGANAADRTLHYIGISGDGDSLSIGLGQLAHAQRRARLQLRRVVQRGLDLADLFGNGQIAVDDECPLVRVGRFQRGKLAIEQGGRHEMAGALGHAPFQIGAGQMGQGEQHIAHLPADQVAIVALERGAGGDGALP